MLKFHSLYQGIFRNQNSNEDWNVVQKFEIQGISNYINTNEKSCIHLSPFADGLIIDKNWYEQRKKFLKCEHSFTLVNEIPINASRKSIEFKNLYKDYLGHYDYRRDMKLLNNDICFVEIDTQIFRTILSDIFINDKMPKEIEKECWYKEIEDCMKKYNNRCFVRGEIMSAKNDNGKQVISSAKECLLYLGKSRDILKSLCDIENEKSYIAIMPWNEKIKLSNEFRIFVLNGKIKAISQQKWYIYAGITRTYILDIISELYQGCLHICKQLPYLDASLDVWIDEDKTVHLIEANPGGRWSCSASMLFNWTDDTIWEEDGPVYVRYIVRPIEPIDDIE